MAARLTARMRRLENDSIFTLSTAHFKGELEASHCARPGVFLHLLPLTAEASSSTLINMLWQGQVS